MLYEVITSATSVQVATALLASQKVAGTAFRIGRTLEAFRRGRRDARVTLRNTDYQKQLRNNFV